MKALFLSDLHLQLDPKRTIPLSESKLSRIRELPTDIDCLLLGGDNAEVTTNLYSHQILFDKLKQHFNCSVGFVVGNHELWGGDTIPSKIMLGQLYLNLANLTETTYLETHSLVIGKYTIIGTYGHYDYSLGQVRGPVTRKSHEIGFVTIDSRNIGWNDKRFMNWQGKSDPEICAELLSEFEQRIAEVEGSLLTISHVVPSIGLVGHLDEPKQDFYRAYAGSDHLGKLIENSKSQYHLCGHTHAPANGLIGNTRVINVGTDYETFGYVLLDTDSGELERVLEPL